MLRHSCHVPKVALRHCDRTGNGNIRAVLLGILIAAIVGRLL